MAEPVTPAPATPSGDGFMVWLEYGFYLTLIGGVVFIVYMVTTGKWQLAGKSDDTAPAPRLVEAEAS